jgi:hypothetical protein
VITGEDFELSVYGSISGSSQWKVYRYAVYENAEWEYAQYHWVQVNSYDKVIDSSGFKWGSAVGRSYTLNREPGTYKFTFVFLDYSAIHRGYGVAVDIEIKVKNRCPLINEINEYIQAQPDESFKNENGNHKIAFNNKLLVVDEFIFDCKYATAINKLKFDIRDKVEKWVVENVVQGELLEMIDALIRCLEERLAKDTCG